MVESASNILIKELDLELRDLRMPGVEVSFVGHGTLTIELQIFGMSPFKRWSLIPLSLSEGWAQWFGSNE